MVAVVVGHWLWHRTEEWGAETKDKDKETEDGETEDQREEAKDWCRETEVERPRIEKDQWLRQRLRCRDLGSSTVSSWKYVAFKQTPLPSLSPKFLHRCFFSSSGSLLKNRGMGEPGNIRGKSCRLLLPCCGGTNQIAERNHVYTWHFVHSAKNCQHENELVSVDYTSIVGEKQLLDVRKGCKSRKSKIKDFLLLVCGTDSLTILCSSEFTCTNCVMELNTTADASKARSEIVNSLRCYQV